MATQVNSLRAGIEPSFAQVEIAEIIDKTKPQKYLFTITQFEQMGEAGIIPEEVRVELIDGEVIVMSPIGTRQAGTVNRISNFLKELLGNQVVTSIQNPVVLNDRREPQPDIVLLKPRDDFYAESRPRPTDILLAVEVADSSEEYDREVKLPQYCESGIPQVLLVLLVDDAIESYAQPVNGEYQNKNRRQRGESLSLESFPQLSLMVEDFLG